MFGFFIQSSAFISLSLNFYQCLKTSYILLRFLLVVNTGLKMVESRKPDKLYATHPSAYGKGSRACRVTGRLGGMGLVRKYGINMKRQVFRERALDMGWEKYN